MRTWIVVGQSSRSSDAILLHSYATFPRVPSAAKVPVVYWTLPSPCLKLIEKRIGGYCLCALPVPLQVRVYRTTSRQQGYTQFLGKGIINFPSLFLTFRQSWKVLPLCTFSAVTSNSRHMTTGSQQEYTQFLGKGVITLPPCLLTFRQSSPTSSNYNEGPRGGVLTNGPEKDEIPASETSGVLLPTASMVTLSFLALGTTLTPVQSLYQQPQLRLQRRGTYL